MPYFVYGSDELPAWEYTRNGRRVGKDDFRKLFDKLKGGLARTTRNKIQIPFQDTVTVRQPDGSLAFNVVDDPDSLRHMFEITPSGKKTSGPRAAAVLQNMPLPIEHSKADYSTSGQEDDIDNQEAWHLSHIKYVSLAVLEVWDQLHSRSGVDHRWFIYLLDYLISLVDVASSGMLHPSVTNIMCFNAKASVPAEPQALHLDNSPIENYPNLFKKNSTETLYEESELADMLADGHSWFPRIWLYFLAFDDNHGIDLYYNEAENCMGTDVMYVNDDQLPTKLSLQCLQKRYLKRLALPFGSLGFVAGSVSHRGIGSDTVPMPPCYRLHSFCHVNGHGNGINYKGTHLMQRGGDIVADEKKMRAEKRRKQQLEQEEEEASNI